MAASFDLDFKSQYDAAKAAIAGTDKFSREFRPLVMKLQKLMGTEGFDAGQEGALTDLRAAIVAGQSQTKVSEDKGILRAADAWTDSDAGTVTAEAKGRAGALKFLRHIYLLNKAGNKKVWIHSLPTAFTHWPNKHLIDKAGTAGAVKTLLRSATEHFTEQQKRYLANSTLQAMAWCQKAGIQLANAKAPCWYGRARRRAGHRQTLVCRNRPARCHAGHLHQHARHGFQGPDCPAQQGSLRAHRLGAVPRHDRCRRSGLPQRRSLHLCRLWRRHGRGLHRKQFLRGQRGQHLARPGQLDAHHRA
jgi:hypothetical protein